MTVQHTNGLELLGKQVSFRHDRLVPLTPKSFITYSENFSGIVTQVLLDIDQSIQIAVENGDFYRISELKDFAVKN